MKREWSTEELAENWTLLPSERELLANKTGATRLGFAVLLKFFQAEARFPRHSQEISGAAVDYLARQIGVPAVEWIHYDWDSRAAKYHHTQIRAQLGFREATTADGEALAIWLDEHVLHQAGFLAGAVRCVTHRAAHAGSTRSSDPVCHSPARGKVL